MGRQHRRCRPNNKTLSADGALDAQFLSASISRRVLGASFSGQDPPKWEGPVSDRKGLKLVRFLFSRPVDGGGETSHP